MKEIEVAILKINKAKVIKNLKKMNAKQVQKNTLFREWIFDFPKKDKKGYIRVRDTGKRVYLTVKTKGAKYMNEFEVDVLDFEKAVEILRQIGCTEMNYVERYRETWKINGCSEIVFDTWPAIPTYIEIECNSEKRVEEIIRKLNLQNELRKPHDDDVYHFLYGIPTNISYYKTPILNFKSVKKAFASHVKKNKALFMRTIKSQLQM